MQNYYYFCAMNNKNTNYSMNGTPYNHFVQALNKAIKAGVPKKYGSSDQYDLGLDGRTYITVEKTGYESRPGYIVIYLHQKSASYFGARKLELLAHVPIGSDENAAFKKACAEASATMQKYANYSR